MARYFFILGLPRSRTAWLANLFTTGRVFCFHDASRMVKDIPNLHTVVHESRVDADFIGTSDNGLPLTPQAINWYTKLDHEVPTVIVRRPPDEVRRALYRFHGEQLPMSLLDLMVSKGLAGLDMLEGSTNSMRVNYCDLDSMPALEAMWEHLIPGVPFNMQRAAALRGMHVELQQPWYDRGFSESFVRMVTAMAGGN